MCWILVCNNYAQTIQEDSPKTPSIQVALLLDTSNSMDGLIIQTTQRIWDVVNVLAKVRYDSIIPHLEFSLYEYGNDNLPAREGYIRQVLPFTNDLDKFSDEIFSLKTKGGFEYAGRAIHQAVHNLAWSQDSLSIRMIYIAGNERFNQGNYPFEKAIQEAIEKDIQIHTIYCGDPERGKRELWELAADLGTGRYVAINHNLPVSYVMSPYDQELLALNDSLNATYLPYGQHAFERKEKQLLQDYYALDISEQNLVNRVVTKVSPLYKNADWDAVDAYKSGIKLIEIQEELLDTYCLPKDCTEQIKHLHDERKSIKKRISELIDKRYEFLEQHESNLVATDDNIGKAIIESVLKAATEKGYQLLSGSPVENEL
ncbi:MAG: vWA domain-containing protein [Weeksellaceae bacterium]|nr:vWA domain-containing protein [Weeksellaceae bacterium]